MQFAIFQSRSNPNGMIKYRGNEGLRNCDIMEASKKIVSGEDMKNMKTANYEKDCLRKITAIR